MLLSLAILMVMLMLLSSVTTYLGRMWSGVNAQIQRRTTGRTLLQFMATELQMARLPTPGAPSAITPGPGNLQFIANLTSADAATGLPPNCLNPHAIFWQAPIAKNNTKGDLAEIGYFVHWDTTTNPNHPASYLSRFFVDPSKQTPTGTPQYLIYSGSNWTSNALSVAPATAPTYSGWLADNVLALFVRCTDSNGQPITQTASGQSLNGGFGFDSLQGYINPSTQAVHDPPALPPCVEITVVVVDSTTALKITPQLLTSKLRPTLTSPADLSKDKTIPGSIQYYINNLPPAIRSGAEIFSTTVYLRASQQ